MLKFVLCNCVLKCICTLQHSAPCAGPAHKLNQGAWIQDCILRSYSWVRQVCLAWLAGKRRARCKGTPSKACMHAHRQAHAHIPKQAQRTCLHWASFRRSRMHTGTCTDVLAHLLVLGLLQALARNLLCVEVGHNCVLCTDAVTLCRVRSLRSLHHPHHKRHTGAAHMCDVFQAAQAL